MSDKDENRFWENEDMDASIIRMEITAVDFPGNRRVVHRGLDIGAFECQTYPPATMVILC